MIKTKTCGTTQHYLWKAAAVVCERETTGGTVKAATSTPDHTILSITGLTITSLTRRQ